MAGWMPVTDPSKVPMRGVRYLADGGYLACRWDDLRLIYEGVPERIYDILRRSAYAGSYYRRYVKTVYPCVDIKKLDPGIPYKPEERTPEKKFAPVKEIPDGETPPQMNLFLLLDIKAKKRSGSS